MARRANKKDESLGAGERLRAVPWALLLQAGVLVTRRWRSLSDKERRRLGELARAWTRHPGQLSEKERRELGRLAEKADLKGIVGDVSRLAGRARGRRRR